MVAIFGKHSSPEMRLIHLNAMKPSQVCLNASDQKSQLRRRATYIKWAFLAKKLSLHVGTPMDSSQLGLCFYQPVFS